MSAGGVYRQTRVFVQGGFLGKDVGNVRNEACI